MITSESDSQIDLSESPKYPAIPNRKVKKEWISQEISRLICREKVRPEDILVLFHRSEEFRDLEEIMRASVGNQLKGFIKPYGPKAGIATIPSLNRTI